MARVKPSDLLYLLYFTLSDDLIIDLLRKVLYPVSQGKNVDQGTLR